MYGFGLSTDHANLINKGKKKKSGKISSQVIGHPISLDRLREGAGYDKPVCTEYCRSQSTTC